MNRLRFGIARQMADALPDMDTELKERQKMKISRWCSTCWFTLFLLVLSIPGVAQVPRQDWFDRLGALDPSPGIYHSRSSISPHEVEPGNPVWFLDPQINISYNPYAPVGGNDGAAWQGAGWNILASGGLQGIIGPLSFTLEPQFSYAQNQSFALMKSARSQGYGDYWSGLDRLQRYGNDSFVHLDWGNTEIRFIAGPVSAGIGTEAVWLGGASRNGIVLSDNAGGFPHLDVGTTVPWHTEWGVFEAKMLWGLVSDSDVYRGLQPFSAERASFLHGLVLSYSPPSFENLNLGLVRVFYSPWRTISWWKAFQSIDDGFLKKDRGQYNGPNGEDDVDQLVGGYLDFQFPDQGFELYAEVARNDHSWDWSDLLNQPDHSLGYTLGVRQILKVFPDWTPYFQYEQTDVGLNIGTTIRPTGSWYRHGGSTPGGYTSGGQLLGASIGPGSNSQYGEVGVVNRTVLLGASVERIANDVDYLLLVIKPPVWSGGYIYDVLMRYSVFGGLRYDRWYCSVQIERDYELTRYWRPGNDFDGIRTSLSVSYDF